LRYGKVDPLLNVILFIIFRLSVSAVFLFTGKEGVIYLSNGSAEKIENKANGINEIPYPRIHLERPIVYAAVLPFSLE